MQDVRISVRNLVEFIMRGGDIDNRFVSVEKDSMLEGSRIHRKIQRSMGGNYRAEVSLKHRIEFEEYCLQIEGRADGIITDEDEVCIDEIKGIYRDVAYLEEPLRVHKAQAMVYAYIYAVQNDLDEIDVQVTYCNIETEAIRRFKSRHTREELDEWFEGLICEYKKWSDFQSESAKKRNNSIKMVEFPFEYREGQRDLAVSVYRTIQRGKTLFIQAPTGVGKTMSTVFPAVKAMGEGHAEKLFYLTAKTITRTVAEEAFAILREKQGLAFRTVTITAKEKLCFCETADCNPINCPYAKGHYDRVNDAVFDIINNEQAIGRECIEEYAKKHNVCPFEFCLDISNWVDGIICDYNYVFDPNVKLKRYFSEGVSGDYLFLIDEAHNLVERAREMYSATLYKESFLETKRILGDRSKKISRCLDNCNKILLEFKRRCVTGYEILESAGGFVMGLMRLVGEMEQFLEDNREFEGRKEILGFYLEVKFFLAIHDLVDENYRIYTEIEEDGRFKIKLFCIHTAKNLKECMDKGKSSILFSATLLPIMYYKELLSGNKEDYAVYAPSPFDRDKRLLLVAKDVTSKYTRRTASEYERIFRYIETVVAAKKGNYMVFFPSYKMMQEVYLLIREAALNENVMPAGEDENRLPIISCCGVEYIMQTNDMSELEREEFLAKFEAQKEHSLVAFCVLGGVFSEGIDLKNDSLIGAIVVGTGLPMVCTEREILKAFYDELCSRGFDYAYRYPGMNKVQQAAGRVIRTDDDEGVIMLLDYRFLERDYTGMFPREWMDYREITLAEAEDILETFWEDRNSEG